MFSGGNVTVYVSNMDRAVRFYSERSGANSPIASATTGLRSKQERDSPSGSTQPRRYSRPAEKGQWRSGCN